jgi:hypothetical protein
MKYLRKFNNHSNYETYKESSDFVTPNLSYCNQQDEIHLDPYSHEYVDLGLPSGTLWAKTNVGAYKETDYGNHYQYGKGADKYQITSGQSEYTGMEDPLAASADTASQSWGENWHTPTVEQIRELTANTIYQWVGDFNNSGVGGAKLTSKTDPSKYIFLPAVGYYYNGHNNGLGTVGNYGSSSPYEIIHVIDGQEYHLLSSYEFDFTYSREYIYIDRNISRESAFSIRPVISGN